jgi:2-hydroxy-6-oxonona-2,4-dienedioate hydrolase
MDRRRKLFAWGVAAGSLGIAGAFVLAKFRAALRSERARVRRGSQLLSSRFGQVQYAIDGEGTPVLTIHGAGGGFDQGISFANRLIEAGDQIIAPPRFGYLASSSPADPSPENQADAFAALLDALAIEKVSVVGASAGALSALQFSIRHPRRCRSLTLVVPAADATERRDLSRLPRLGLMTRAVIETAIRSDFLFWLGIVTAPNLMIRSVLATDPALVAAATPNERSRAYGILWNVLPISERSLGLMNDARFTTTPQTIPLDQMKVPTLVISLEDDGYGTIAPARHIAAEVSGSRLVTYPSGGHIWIGHHEEVFAEVNSFIKQHLRD